MRGRKHYEHGRSFLVILFILIVLLATNVRIVPQAYAYVIERLGGYDTTWGVGLHFKVPFLDRVAKRVNLKEQVADFPPQPVITKDNATIQIDTVVFSRLRTRRCMHMASITRLWRLRS